ncbi:MFS transporter [Acidipila sp. EB88]|uniref:MFS transporter n=1 Tax=Acidipila sp. EB88 TaxID=2305226 RepID=UPI001F158480|nr:MFS transporter [Acidipila sp. EB88]
MFDEVRALGAHWQRLKPTQRHAFLACFLGWALDAFDYFLLVLCIPAIATEFHTGTKAVLEAVSLTLLFRPVGALLFGTLAERFGRRPTLIFNIACYSLLELACAFAPSLPVLLVLRALFGIAMGGEWGVGAALVFETLPVEGRGFFSGVLQEGYAVGYLLAALVFGVLFDPLAHLHVAGHVVGWRGLFVVGALPGLLCLYINRKVEESPTWTQGRAQAALPGQRRAALWTGMRAHLGTFLFLVLLMAGFNAFSHGTQDLYPTFLIKDHHASAHEVGLIGVIYNIGAIGGGILFGALSERWGRKRAIITAALLALPCVPLFALAHSLPLLALGAFLMQFMVQGAWGVVPAYLSELSPAETRATFPGVAYQLGNLLTSRNIVLQGWAAARVGAYGPVLAGTVLIVGIFLAVVCSLGRESRGKKLVA